MKRKYYSSERIEMLKYLPDTCQTILEIGCGEGNFAKLCKEKTGAFIIGIEYSENAGKIAQTKIDKVFIGDAVEEIHNIENYSVDVVIINDVLEHIAYPDQLLDSLKSKIKKNGLLIASIPNFRYVFNLIHIIWYKNFRYEKQGGIRDYTHLRFFTRKSIIAFFEESNFNILKIEGIKSFKTNSIKRKLLLIAINLFGQKDTKYLQFAIVCKPD